MHGLVIRNTGSHYVVRSDDGALHEVNVKGNFRLRGIRATNPVAIGDWVTFDGGLISEIDDRRNYVVRKATNLSKQSHVLAANVDRALLVVTLREPETSLTFIDRFLASAEAYQVPVTLLVNKVDLLADTDGQSVLAALLGLYRPIGYECLAVSAATGQGLGEVRRLLDDRVSLLSGHSGVGKTSLVNALFPQLHLRTSAVSDAYGTGRHTTTFSEMFPVSGQLDAPGGYLIDTPGIKGFGTFDFRPEEVSHYFRDIFRQAEACRFSNCTHTHEPGCAVLQAVEDGRLAASRYNSYLSMLGDQDEDRYRPAF